MSKISLVPNASGTGTLSIASPSTNSDYTLTLPAETGTVLTSGGAIDVNASAPADSLAISSSGKVGVGTSSPASRLSIQDTAGTGDFGNGVLLDLFGGSISAVDTGVGISFTRTGSQMAYIQARRESASTEAAYLAFATQTSAGSHPERMRIDSSGNLLVNTTSNTWSAKAAVVGTSTYGGLSVEAPGSGSWYPVVFQDTDATSGSQQLVHIRRGSSNVGYISTTNSSTNYATSSDYRLKENVAPMTGALATVAALKPCTYTWKADGSAGQGFIAHELQAVVPDAVTGEKDAVETYTDEEGIEQTRPVYQGVDTSFLVATLTAAIQELSAKNDALEARIAALEAA